ncbi:hypothetical protein BDK51DRAFT_41048 [Blyttiomyces helicus]|uniref:Uncharacterized protein n=1 Tax=Blyttiomyces helicus TaxID=388810 RepID=A0A4P9W550_9FUNG|nr:hypothetical protein BDK51DRAFT_41048 [Blyttiomyces helicus]|eukprot:RKO86433.1 hypothetical protein BDK51DRAFT_41048 [Blyttiomyces helicus]
MKKAYENLAALINRLGYGNTMILLLWFDLLIRTEGDSHPEQGILYLPAGNPKAFLYNNYLDHYNQVNTVPATQFYHMWDTHYWRVEIKRLSNFSMCNMCTEIKSCMADKHL